MKEDNKNIDKLFSSLLKEYKEKPPLYGWDNLNNDLNRIERRKKILFIRYAAAIVLLLITFGAGYFFGIYNISNDKVLTAPDNKSVKLSSSGQQEKVLRGKDGKRSVPDEKPFTGNVNSSKKTLEKTVLTAQISSDNRSSGLQSKPENVPVRKTERYAPVKRLALIPVNSVTLCDNFYPESVFINKTVMQAEYSAQLFYPEKDIDMEYAFTGNTVDNKWIVGAQFAPVSPFRDISTNYTDNSLNNEEFFNENEEMLKSISGGINLSYRVSRKIAFQSGFYYSTFGQVNNNALAYEETDGKYLLYSISSSIGVLNFDKDILPQDVVSTKDTVVNRLSAKVYEKFDIVEVPIMLRYGLLDKTVSLNITGGISPAFVTRNDSYIEFDNQKFDVDNSANINPVYFNGTVSLDVGYNISGSFSINFQPTFKYALSPLNKGADFSYHPYSISWFTGVRYDF